ncbi:MAG: mannose-1-phosphate guanylyltransferase [Bacteroidota bacterium]|nr:mannose-1-phosphate guanylyltransferase [Bacteroidota bacterium]
MDKHYYGVIMAGGIGSRFWPLSKKNYPKQFHDILSSGKTMFQATYERLLTACPAENIMVVANEAYREIIKIQIPQITDEQILGEPHARNTAPCVAYAAARIATKDAKAIMAVLPSDHHIPDSEKFGVTLKKAFEFAAGNDALLTLGIKPTRPDTGYGYIQITEDKHKGDFYKVKTFTEKPNRELADHFVKSGEFLWNSGMFIWKVSAINKAYKNHLPEIYALFHDGAKHYFTSEESMYVQKAYELCTIISIDYGILEKAENVFVLPSDFNWSDIGTWNALHDFSKKDSSNNVIHGDMVFLRNTENSIVHVPNKKLVALNNVKNLIVVESDGVLLIADINREQEIRQVVNDIKIKYGEKYT